MSCQNLGKPHISLCSTTTYVTNFRVSVMRSVQAARTGRRL